MNQPDNLHLTTRTQQSKQRHIDYVFTRANSEALKYLRPIFFLPHFTESNVDIHHAPPISLSTEINLTFNNTTKLQITRNIYQEGLLSISYTQPRTSADHLTQNQRTINTLGHQITSNYASPTPNSVIHYHLLFWHCRESIGYW